MLLGATGVKASRKYPALINDGYFLEVKENLSPSALYFNIIITL